jgi:hypothetical protein
MSISSIGSSQTQIAGNLLLQQLMASGSNSLSTGSSGSLLEDLLTLSPTAQQVSQAPDAVAQAMGDLLSGQTDVQGDLARLKSYFQQNPQGLASLLGSLQGDPATYNNSSATARNALLTALMNGQSNTSDPTALLSLIQGAQGQSSLFDFLGNSSSESNSGGIFG